MVKKEGSWIQVSQHSTGLLSAWWGWGEQESCQDGDKELDKDGYEGWGGE